jgi:phosphopentomutase
MDFLKEDFTGIIFSNLIEFDMIYGHRNDVTGYAAKLEEFDLRIPQIRAAMGPADIAVIVADHGVDPTTPSTDHSREYIPLLVFGQNVLEDVNLGIRKSYSDLAATIAEIFDLEPPEIGTSFLGEIIK